MKLAITAGSAPQDYGYTILAVAASNGEIERGGLSDESRNSQLPPIADPRPQP
jgi:hypothetical protein